MEDPNDLTIPDFLRRSAVNLDKPAELHKAVADAVGERRIISPVTPASESRYDRKQRRRLRAEVKALRHQLELLQKYNMPKSNVKEVQKRLLSAERALYLVS